MNQKAAASGNRLRVLGLIARRKCLSQRRLAAATGLQASTVSNIVRDLKGLGVIQEGAPIEAERVGPKEMELEVIPGAAWSIGLHLLDTGHKLTMVNAMGHTLVREQLPPGLAIEELIDSLPGRVAELAERHRVDPARFAGVGVAAPGVVDSGNGVILMSRALRLESYPIRAKIRETLACPVWVERDVACGAYSEHHAGVARDRGTFLYMLIRSEPGHSDTFGLAIVIGEKIFRGCNLAAGEIDPHFLGNCRFEGGMSERQSESLIDSFYRSCASTIGSITNLLDISSLVLCSDDSGLTQRRFEGLQCAVNDLLIQVPGRRFELVRSTIGSDGIVLGSALLALHRHLAAQLEARQRQKPVKPVKPAKTTKAVAALAS